MGTPVRVLVRLKRIQKFRYFGKPLSNGLPDQASQNWSDLTVIYIEIARGSRNSIAVSRNTNDKIYWSNQSIQFLSRRTTESHTNASRVQISLTLWIRFCKVFTISLNYLLVSFKGVATVRGLEILLNEFVGSKESSFIRYHLINNINFTSTLGQFWWHAWYRYVLYFENTFSYKIFNEIFVSESRLSVGRFHGWASFKNDYVYYVYYI